MGYGVVTQLIVFTLSVGVFLYIKTVFSNSERAGEIARMHDLAWAVTIVLLMRCIYICCRIFFLNHRGNDT